MEKKRPLVTYFFGLLVFGLFLIPSQVNAGTNFRFTVVGDNRATSGFGEFLEEIKADHGDEGVFHLNVGDFSPADATFDKLKTAFGNDVVWYPVVGNHETYEDEGPEPGINNLPWLRDYYYQYLEGKVNPGPEKGVETTYSWDYGDAHFVVLNVQYSGTVDDSGMGAIRQKLLDWLIADLDKNTKPIIFVFGHEPAFPQPDAYDGSLRNEGDTLGDLTDAFWDLLEEKNVTAYIHGHIHLYARCQPKTTGENRCVFPDGFLSKYHGDYPKPGSKVWQTAAAYRKSIYDNYLNIMVTDSEVHFESWRDIDRDGDFTLYDSWTAPVIGFTPTPTPSTTCPHRSSGDVNCDGRVNISDLVLVGANFGTTNVQADANGDGLVNIVDLVLVGANFGNSF